MKWLQGRMFRAGNPWPGASPTPQGLAPQSDIPDRQHDWTVDRRVAGAAFSHGLTVTVASDLIKLSAPPWNGTNQAASAAKDFGDKRPEASRPEPVIKDALEDAWKGRQNVAKDLKSEQT
jgi:hypothetical protein